MFTVSREYRTKSIYTMLNIIVARECAKCMYLQVHASKSQKIKSIPNGNE